MDSLAYLDPTTENAAAQSPTGQNPTVQNPTAQNPTAQLPSATESGPGSDAPESAPRPDPHGDVPTGAPQRPSPPNLADVLGPGAPVQEPPGPSLIRRSLKAVRAGLAVLARPRVAGVLVFGLGVLIILLLGYVYVFTPVSAQRAQHTLLQEITASPAKTFDLAVGKVPPEGSPVAVLEIPSLHLDQAVVEGTNAQDLRNGPGHLPSTALPGQAGNAVIMARRATYGAPFGAIGTLHKGAVITVVDGYGTYHYRVSEVVYATADRHDVVTPTNSNRLTLATASSGFFPQGRLAVIAKLEGKPFPGTTEPHLRVPASELGLSGDPVSGLLFVLWSILFFVLLSGAAWLLRNWNQPIVVYLLALPILLVVALFACESLIGFLPATV
jgi:sortase A